MNDTLCQDFFSQPACPAQRQYEALRAVFLDGLPQNVTAARFGYSPNAFRQLVHQFRRDVAADAPPPFSSANDVEDRPALPSRQPASPTPPMSPTSASWI